MKSALFIAASAAGLLRVFAQDTGYDNVTIACLPFNSSGAPDLDAPCNQQAMIENLCFYGTSAGLAFWYQMWADPNATNEIGNSSVYEAPTDPPALDFLAQRDCICSSQYFSLATGCDACFSAHAYTPESTLANTSAQYASVSSAYCAASATPTTDFYDFFANIDDSADSEDPSSMTLSTYSASDPLSGATAVSLYYTPSITGSAAWLVSEVISATVTSDGNTIIEASVPGVRTSNGQIVATQVAANAASGSQTTGSATVTGSHSGAVSGNGGSSTGSPSSSTHSGGAAAPTQAFAAAGMIGVAVGVVALL